MKFQLATRRTAREQFRLWYPRTMLSFSIQPKLELIKSLKKLMIYLQPDSSRVVMDKTLVPRKFSGYVL